MAMQIINKTGDGANVNAGWIVCNTEDTVSVLISDDRKEIYEILESQGLTLVYGEYIENTIETRTHDIEESIADGGGNSALKDGQIIVIFDKG